ncbi:unnamed protein product [Notodromas monacha]|uniref:Lysosomal dipeptide transporter MFSD1 n=1 Tax=Notodromas monacha TaxID=399045 RepID=A0A7R9BU01_9CRUS|nr:unnamed protein product [Notodromas monacha]CAG0921713.1 unnamed protein product [Notodromas monacha]
MTEVLDDRTADVAPLIRDEDSRDSTEQEPDLKVGCDFCCNPNRTCYRFIALFLMCFMGFGSYFCYDNPGALQTYIKADMGVTTSEFANLYSWYSWPNVILCFVGGYLVDSVFGIRFGTALFALIVFAGQIIFALGGLLNKYWLMEAGRFVFGIGGESLAVAQNTYAVSWFMGKELNMVFGLQMSFARVGSTVNFNMMVPLYDYIHQYYKGYQCTGIVLMIAAVFCLLSFICASALGWLDYRRAKLTGKAEAETGEVIQLRDIFDFGASFWLATAICVSYYVAIFPLIGLGQIFFQRKYGLSSSAANAVNGIVYIIAAFASPLFGIIMDKTGRNVLWCFIAIVCTLGSFAGLTFTFVNPYIPMVSVGLSYSLLASALWPMVALLLPEHQLGTAYGIMQAAQNLGLAVITMLAGWIVDTKGYFVLLTFFILCLSVSLMAIIVLWVLDYTQNGLLNLSIEAREARRIESMLAKRDSISSMDSRTRQAMRLSQSEFSLRNRFLSRIGAQLPPTYDVQTRALAHRKAMR